MNDSSYKSEFVVPANSFGTKWYKPEASRESVLSVPINTVTKRLDAAFTATKGKVKRGSIPNITYTGSIINNQIDASFFFPASRGKTEHHVRGRLTANKNETRIEVLIKDETPFIFFIIQPLLIFLGTKFILHMDFAFLVVIAFAVFKYVGTMLEYTSAAGTIAEALCKIASTDNLTEKAALVPEPKLKMRAFESLHAPVKSAGSFKSMKERLSIVLVVIFWAAIFFVLPVVLSVPSERTYLKCTITRCERYQGGAKFWICYKFNNRTYNIRMYTPLGKNYVGSQVFIKLDNGQPDAPFFLQDQPVPDCLVKIQPPPEGWEEIPRCK